MAVPGLTRGGGANSKGMGGNLLFSQKFPKNCVKRKEFGPRGGARVPGAPPLLDPPMYLHDRHSDHSLPNRSATLPN